MGLVVQKFGGSSVATANRIMAAARKAVRAKQQGKHVLVVVSARGDTTDELIELANEITDSPPAREMDMLLSTGEQISISLMAMAIQTLGEKSISFTGAQVGIVTDSSHTRARIKSISAVKMRQALETGQIVIVAGFQGTDDDGNITTLGRGGSDTTAVALAACMKQDTPEQSVECEIYTDVDGIYTTDPRIVPEARKIDAISYDEMLELASVGAGVMHSRSIEFAKKFDVPLIVRSSFSDSMGTWIVPEQNWMATHPVCGAAIVKDEARVSVGNVPNTPGVCHKFFTALATNGVIVDMIAQNPGNQGRASIGFTVPAFELRKTLELIEPIARQLGAAVEHDGQVSKVSIVGSGMKKNAGVAQCMFEALANEKINLRMITTGDIKISVLVDKQDGIKALRTVHQAFKLGENNSSSIKLRQDFDSKHLAFSDLTNRLTNMEDILVSEIITQLDEGRVAVHGMLDNSWNCSKIFKAVANSGIVVDMIVQNLSGGIADLSFSVPLNDLDRARLVTKEVIQEISPSSIVDSDPRLATVHVIGVGMRTHTGVATKIFGALAENKINILMINSSEIRISVVVDRNRVMEATNILKNAFKITI